MGSKAAFWGAVAGVSLLAAAGVQLAAVYVPSPGLRRFVDFIHGNASRSS